MTMKCNRYGNRVMPAQTYLVNVKSQLCHDGFVDEACFDYYLTRLLHCLNVFHVELHAYCLLPQDIFLLITPGVSEGPSLLLDRLNGCYSDYFNARFFRYKRVWRSRINFSLVQSRALILDCQKFIERLPLAEQNTKHPGAYSWSSYCANSFGINSPYLTAHRSYQKFVQHNGSQYRGYRDFVATPFHGEYEDYLDSRLRFGLPLAKRQYQPETPVATKRLRYA
jgi:hypothetical protein